jgi:hypothetical protein
MSALNESCYQPDQRCGWTYVLRWVGHRRVKIGRCDANLVARLTSIQMSSPVELEVVAVGHWSPAEAVLHERHGATRLHNEWFNIHHAALSRSLQCIDGVCFGCAIRRTLPDDVVSKSIRQARRPDRYEHRARELGLLSED